MPRNDFAAVQIAVLFLCACQGSGTDSDQQGRISDTVTTAADQISSNANVRAVLESMAASGCPLDFEPAGFDITGVSNPDADMYLMNATEFCDGRVATLDVLVSPERGVVAAVGYSVEVNADGSLNHGAFDGYLIDRAGALFETAYAPGWKRVADSIYFPSTARVAEASEPTHLDMAAETGAVDSGGESEGSEDGVQPTSIGSDCLGCEAQLVTAESRDHVALHKCWGIAKEQQEALSGGRKMWEWSDEEFFDSFLGHLYPMCLENELFLDYHQYQLDCAAGETEILDDSGEPIELAPDQCGMPMCDPTVPVEDSRCRDTSIQITVFAEEYCDEVPRATPACARSREDSPHYGTYICCEDVDEEGYGVGLCQTIDEDMSCPQ